MKSPEQSPAAQLRLQNYNPEVVAEVAAAVGSNRVVVVGMAWNPHVPKVRKALGKAGVEYTYLGYGNYLSGWQKRLAIKLWSRWPTFPQVFVDGELLGGKDQTVEAIANGSLSPTA